MRIVMSYGKTGLPLNLPDDWDVTIIRTTPMPQLSDADAAIADALRHPVGSRPVKDLAAGRKNVCIVICDITRPVPNGTILPVLIRELLDAGIDAGSISILIATGLHRPNEGPEMAEVVGSPWLLETVRVANHFARKDDEHTSLGATRKGTPVKLDRRFVNADLRIVLGLVEPHFMAGYSGGRKLITPGIAHRDTIASLHAARFLEDPGAANCVLEGNPVHEEQMEITGMVGECFAINVVIDEARRISFVNFGSLHESHFQAVAFMRAFAEIKIPRRFRTVVTSGAGYPLDKNYYQTVKGMVAAMDALEPGGNLFIVSECSEGIGSEEFRESQRKLIEVGAEAFIKNIEPKQYAGIDEWETEMLLKAMRGGQVHLFSGCLLGAERDLTAIHMVDSPEEAIRTSIEQSGDRRVAVIPEGPYVIPIYTETGYLARTCI